MEEDKLLDCIAEESYNTFCRAIKEKTECYAKKQLVIFGAGIMGLQFSYALELCGRNEFVFCDNDKNKQGKTLRGRYIVSPKELCGQAEQYFIFLAIENGRACAEQIEAMGYRQNIEWYNLADQSETKFIKDFMDRDNAEALVLADCFAINISFSDKKKKSLTSLLSKENNIKVLSMNGLYMRSYYILFLMSLKRMPFIKKLVLLLDISIFHEKYYLLSGNQHKGIMDKLYKISGIDTEESRLFLEEIGDREKNISIGYVASPDRSDHLFAEKIEQGRRLHMKLNWMYELKEDIESIIYLDKLLQRCKEKNIECCCVFLPVNYEMGETYFGEKFYKKYEQIRDGIKKHIDAGEGFCLDLSYMLRKESFISIRSVNEGIKEAGRNRIADSIKRNILN